ncbi:DUF2007 domain-containing protein [Nitriliruptoraceae bacterium ZYF776]|nr:DUF2007 domain-containing protein [Profundirhabdus halotolerans]
MVTPVRIRSGVRSTRAHTEGWLVERWVQVTVLRSRPDAEVARSALDSADIPTTIVGGEDVAYAMGPSTNAIELRVPADRLDEARQLLHLPSVPEPDGAASLRSLVVHVLVVLAVTIAAAVLVVLATS